MRIGIYTRQIRGYPKRGQNDLVFDGARMLHWPDSMFTYMTNDNILFSNDAFGQHYASEYMYNDLVDPDELYSEAMKCTTLTY